MPERIPPLEQGDHLTRAEFERRYEAMPHLKKAELIEGVVHMPSPVRIKMHGRQHNWLSGWITTYEAETPGVESAGNTTIRLDLDNEPQPDVLLRILPEKGCQSQDEDGYMVDAPEFAAEVSASTASYDLHEQKRVYRRNRVLEYLVWLVAEDRIEWWRLDEGDYVSIPPGDDGILRSTVFPGLWLDANALLDGNLARVFEVVRQGAESEEHAAFAAGLASR